MSALCDVALVFGLTLSGLCAEPPAPKPEPLPEDDAAAWAGPGPAAARTSAGQMAAHRRQTGGGTSCAGAGAGT